MAGENVVGELSVLITGKDAGASAAIDRVKGKAETASGSLKKMGDAATKVQGAVSKILMPAALIGSILGAVTAMNNLTAAAKRARDAFTKMGDDSSGRLSALIVELRGVNAAEARMIQLSQQLVKENKASAESFSVAAQATRNFFDNIGTLISLGDNLGTVGDAASGVADEMDSANEAARKIVAEMKILKALLDDFREDADKPLFDFFADGIGTLGQAAETTAERMVRLREENVAFAEQQRKAAKEAADIEEEARKKRIADFERENDAHRQRMKDLREYEEAIRNSIIGGLFGGGAVAGGDVGAVASALGQIADKLGGAR